jgi:tripartite-type tricarboxylate transporter receptor subunit TctC
MTSPLNRSRRSALITIACCASALAVPRVFAADSDKPISLMVGYAAGGSVDAIARLIAGPLSQRLGQPIVVENYGGAGGSIGASRVAKAPADGSTLMVGSGSEVAIAWAVNPSLPYNGLKDLQPIGLISASPMVLVGNNKLPARDLASLIQYGKTHPGKLSLATSGVGTPQHLLLEYMNRKLGMDILHVPYRSAASIIQDVIGGRVDLSILTLSTAQPYIESKQLQAYAVTGESPAAALPGVPSITQTPELRGKIFDLWFGLLAPAGLPAAQVTRINKALNEVLQLPEIRQALEKQGMIASPGTAAEFAAYTRADSEKYQKIIKQANIVVK